MSSLADRVDSVAASAPAISAKSFSWVASSSGVSSFSSFSVALKASSSSLSSFKVFIGHLLLDEMT